MGTRSTVKFYNQNKPILSVYHQYDGYIGGVGHNLANFLLSKKMINGFSHQTMEQGFANGMGCLAAQYVKENKKSIGGLYLTSEDDQQEFNYVVRFKDDRFEISVGEFTGTPEELLEWNESEDE